jgi:hypothetical protein
MRLSAQGAGRGAGALGRLVSGEVGVGGIRVRPAGLGQRAPAGGGVLAAGLVVRWPSLCPSIKLRGQAGYCGMGFVRWPC